jgi:TusA-related sulfurtransferase
MHFKKHSMKVDRVLRRRLPGFLQPHYEKELMAMPELTDITIDKEIDARGSFCPGPLMELIRGMKALPVGGVLAVLSSDPGSAKDIPAWIQKARHEYLGAFPEDGYTRFVARKAR